MHLLAQPALRADAEAVADDQHPDHQFRIDRGAADLAVEGPKVSSDSGQIHEPVDRAKQVIGRDMPLDTELVEQRLLHHRPLAHHRRILLRSKRTESGLQSASNADFFNTISGYC